MEDTKSFRLLRIAREILANRANKVDGEDAESGFTLIELMVVLLIMAILLAIAIPTFLGVKGGAQDRAVQSNLTNSAISAKATYTNAGDFGTAAAFDTTMQSTEPELTFQTAASAADTQISTATVQSVVAVGKPYDILVMNVQSKNGHCYWAEDNESAAVDAVTAAKQGVYYAKTAGACPAATQAGAPAGAGAWTSNYP